MSEDQEKTPEQIEAEIAEVREDLGDSVTELADRADVKKQVGRKATEIKDQVSEKVKGAADPLGGSGGDIGSGPTGDVRNSPEILGKPVSSTLPIAVASLVVGLLLGRMIWR